jgi:mannose-6-phosphate isomerase-like protein (cupin superfamily)
MEIIPPAEGELIGDAPDRRVEILCEDDALHATWFRVGPRREGADLHVHRRHSDLFYVLSGELTVRLGPDGEAVAVPAGTLARVPPLVVHGYRNASAAEVCFLNFHAPGTGFAGYLRARRDGRPHDFDQEPPPEDGGRPVGDAYVGAPGVAFDEISLAELERPSQPDEPQWLYVLAGELEVGGRRAGAGSWVSAPHAVNGSGRHLALRGRDESAAVRRSESA